MGFIRKNATQNNSLTADRRLQRKNKSHRNLSATKNRTTDVHHSDVLSGFKPKQTKNVQRKIKSRQKSVGDVGTTQLNRYAAKKRKQQEYQKALDAMPVEDADAGNSIEEGVDYDTWQATQRVSVPELVNASRALEIVNDRKNSMHQSSRSNMSTYRSAMRLSHREQFERDYEFPPTANCLR